MHVKECRRFSQIPYRREANQICSRFHEGPWQHGRQVMWGGLPRQLISFGQIDTMQTLTKAMGPLMVHGDTQCLWSLQKVE